MIDTVDLFGQWINVPEDLPPVDEDGLNNLASFGPQVDRFIDHHRYEPNSGLLLAHPNAPQVADVFDAISNCVQIASDPSLSSQSSAPYANLCPPALSPDCSPYSIASSTPWLRTPLTDPSPANVANLTPVNGVWDIGAEETCDTIHFVDQSGNSLEDVPLQVHNVMPEDIACIPQTIYDDPPNTPSFIISPSQRAPTLQQDDSVPPIHCASQASSSPHWQSLFTYSPVTYCSQESSLSSYPASQSSSPLSTLSFLSQSPSASPGYLPSIDYSSASPALSHMPSSDSGGRVEVTSPFPSTFGSVSSVDLRGTRNMSVVDEDDPVFGTPRRPKAKNHDEEEWNPASGRVKRPRVKAPSQLTGESPSSNAGGLLDESEPTRPEGSSDAGTHMCCEHCGQSFTRASDRIRHMENSANHPETRKMWPCSYCNSALGRKDALVRHIRTLHRGAPVLIQGEGVLLESRLQGSQETLVQRMGPRKMTLRRQPRRDARTRNR